MNPLLLAALFLLHLPYSSTNNCGSCACNEFNIRCKNEDVTEFPYNFTSPSIKLITITNTSIRLIRREDFANYLNLQNLVIDDNPMLSNIEPNFLANQRNLFDLSIVNNKALTHIPTAAFNISTPLRNLWLTNNSLAQIPDLSQLTVSGTTMPLSVFLDYNPLDEGGSLCSPQLPSLPNLATCKFGLVSINETTMTRFDVNILNGTISIAELRIAENPLLSWIDEDAFLMLTESPIILSLSNNPRLTNLPYKGLGGLRKLHFEKCPLIKQIPATVKFEDISYVRLTYPQHCCAFRRPEIQDKQAFEAMANSKVSFCAGSSRASYSTTSSTTYSSSISDSSAASPIRRKGPDFLPRRRRNFDIKWLDFNGTTTHTLTRTTSRVMPQFEPTIDPYITHVIKLSRNCSESDFSKMRRSLDCSPEETAFTPCVDIFEEKHHLRSMLLVECFLAIIGNSVVLIFTLAGAVLKNQYFTVTKFLICNLAIADLIQGVYLLSVAAVDLESYGQYFNFATWWQQEGGCDVVGFLSVFATELSIFTLGIITLERWYAISHAIHLTKRLQMKHACVIMLVAWCLSLTAATLPLVEFSSYQLTSICLPFRFTSDQDKGYIYALLCTNSVVFLAVLIFYMSIFYQVRSSIASTDHESYKIAWRMAILVFTDLICWGPIAVVGGLAAGGINVQDKFNASTLLIAKFILVVFYPLNSCANPFLYAIITKQFKEDFTDTLNRCGICKKKKKVKGRRRDDTTTRNTLNARSSLTSNITQLTSVYMDSRGYMKRGSIDFSLPTVSQASSLPAEYQSNRDVGSYEMKLIAYSISTAPAALNSRHKRLFRSPSPYYNTSSSLVSSSNSIDSSRRPSDTINVPETLLETDRLMECSLSDMMYPGNSDSLASTVETSTSSTGGGDIAPASSHRRDSTDEILPKARGWKRDQWISKATDRHASSTPCSSNAKSELDEDSGAECLHDSCGNSDSECYLLLSVPKMDSEVESGYRGRQQSQEEDDLYWRQKKLDKNFNKTFQRPHEDPDNCLCELIPMIT